MLIVSKFVSRLVNHCKVVSNCVVQCLPQRSIIKETGILEALWILVEKDGKKTLSVSSCEFLQACIYAKEYHYAYQQISDTWPLPTKDYLAKVGNTTPSVEILLRYYYLRGVICMGCEPIYHPLAIRCFWTCLIVPVASDANAVSAIAVAAWKKMVLLQSLSPIGIVHSTASAVGSNPDKPSSKMISMSVASSSGNVPLGSTPIFTNPLSTPKDMSWDLVRFFSQAKPPTGLRFANPSTFLTEAVSVPSKGVESSISAQHADDSIASMHVIEMDTGIATNLVVDTSNVGADTSGSFRSDKPVSNEGNSTSQTVTNALPTRVHYPSLGVYVYKQLIEAYICIDRRKFDAILQECSELFENDGNLGLVQHVGFALLNRHIYELSRVYGTISLDDLGVEMNLPSHVVHSLLDDLQTKLSWPVRLVPLSSDTTIDSKKSGVIVVFPAELPHPNLDVDNSDVSLTKQLNDLTVMVRLLGGAIAASPKYKSALAAAERRNVNTGTSVLGPMSVELV